MSKLYERAKVKRAHAEMDYRNLSMNNAYLDECCFNLQQAIEFGLKYIVEMHGENYAENHDVRAQLNQLKALRVSLPFENQIRSLASTLNSWETESRYNDDFTALLEDIQDSRRLADEILTYCSGLALPVSEDEEK